MPDLTHQTTHLGIDQRFYFGREKSLVRRHHAASSSIAKTRSGSSHWILSSRSVSTNRSASGLKSAQRSQWQSSIEPSLLVRDLPAGGQYQALRFVALVDERSRLETQVLLQPFGADLFDSAGLQQVFGAALFPGLHGCFLDRFRSFALHRELYRLSGRLREPGSPATPMESGPTPSCHRPGLFARFKNPFVASGEFWYQRSMASLGMGG